jgi:hypothetical protein
MTFAVRSKPLPSRHKSNSANLPGSSCELHFRARHAINGPCGS